MARYAALIARRLDLAPAQVHQIRLAAALHDIGKLHIPRQILDKPGRLTDLEFEVVKCHPGDGADMIEALIDDPELVAIVRHHHERLDGNGYPSRLAGDEIPLGARIIAVADTFDAITSSRSYRQAQPHKTALAIMRREAGAQLDPDAVRAFRGAYFGRRWLWIPAAAVNAGEQLLAGVAFRLAGVAAVSAGMAAVSVGPLVAPAIPVAQPGLLRVAERAPAVRSARRRAVPAGHVIPQPRHAPGAPAYHRSLRAGLSRLTSSTAAQRHRAAPVLSGGTVGGSGSPASGPGHGSGATGSGATGSGASGSGSGTTTSVGAVSVGNGSSSVAATGTKATVGAGGVSVSASAPGGPPASVAASGSSSGATVSAAVPGASVGVTITTGTPTHIGVSARLGKAAAGLVASLP